MRVGVHFDRYKVFSEHQRTLTELWLLRIEHNITELNITN
jgi:hypothetical protein